MNITIVKKYNDDRYFALYKNRVYTLVTEDAERYLKNNNDNVFDGYKVYRPKGYSAALGSHFILINEDFTFKDYLRFTEEMPKKNIDIYYYQNLGKSYDNYIITKNKSITRVLTPSNPISDYKRRGKDIDLIYDNKVLTLERFFPITTSRRDLELVFPNGKTVLCRVSVNYNEYVFGEGRNSEICIKPTTRKGIVFGYTNNLETHESKPFGFYNKVMVPNDKLYLTQEHLNGIKIDNFYKLLTEYKDC